MAMLVSSLRYGPQPHPTSCTHQALFCIVSRIFYCDQLYSHQYHSVLRPTSYRYQRVYSTKHGHTNASTYHQFSAAHLLFDSYLLEPIRSDARSLSISSYRTTVIIERKPYSPHGHGVRIFCICLSVSFNSPLSFAFQYLVSL